MKEFCCISFLKKIKDKKNFDNFLLAYILKNKKTKKINFDVLIIPKKFLKDNDGKNLLYKIFDLKKEKNFLIAIEGIESYNKNKEYLELKKSGIPIIDIFFPYFKEGKLHYADSGINHVLLNIMKNNKIAIGIDFEKIRKALEKKDFNYLSNIIQNAKWARKKKVNFCLFINTKKNSQLPDALDLFNFLIFIGFDTKQAKNALIYPKIKIELNEEIFKHKYGDVFIYKKDEKIKLIDYIKAIEA